MSNGTFALRQAMYMYRRREMIPWERMEGFIVELGRLGVFSCRQVCSIVDADPRRVNHLISDRGGGGRFNPVGLEHMVKALEAFDSGRPHAEHVAEALKRGTSPYMVERLTGIPRHRLLAEPKCPAAGRHLFKEGGKPTSTCQREGCAAANPNYKEDA